MLRTDKLGRLLEHISGNEDETSLEHRIFNLQCGILVVIMVIIVMMNVILNLGILLIVITVLAMLLFTLMYYLSRVYKLTDAIFWPYVIILMLIQCAAWYINGGAESSNVITMLAMGILLSIITRKDRRLPLSIFYILVISALYGTEYLYPQLITPYSNKLSFYIDSYVSFLYSFIGLFSMIAIVLNSYHRLIAVVEQEKAQLTVLTQRDTLTGTYNRRYMEAALIAADQLNKAADQGYCLIVIDLDHFKNINDAYGHMGGDKVLIEFVTLLSASIAPHDLLGRVGGEEFLIICRESSSETALQKAEECRKLIESSVISYDNNEIRLTASFGVSCNASSSIDGRELWKMADKALYIAKNNGRNRVEGYP